MFWSEMLTCISYYIVDACIRKEKKKKNPAIRNEMVSNMVEKKKREIKSWISYLDIKIKES